MRFILFRTDTERAVRCFLACAVLASCMLVSTGCSLCCGSCAKKSASQPADEEVRGMVGHLDADGNWAPLPPGEEVPSTGGSPAPAEDPVVKQSPVPGGGVYIELSPSAAKSTTHEVNGEKEAQ